MDVAALLTRIQSRADYAGQLVHLESLPERAGRYAAPSQPLPSAFAQLLSRRGFEQLYVHQIPAL